MNPLHPWGAARALRLGAATLALASTMLLAGCEVLLLGGAVVGTGLVATDRRTAGTQLEDESIALK